MTESEEIFIKFVSEARESCAGYRSPVCTVQEVLGLIAKAKRFAFNNTDIEKRGEFIMKLCNAKTTLEGTTDLGTRIEVDKILSSIINDMMEIGDKRGKK